MTCSYCLREFTPMQGQTIHVCPGCIKQQLRASENNIMLVDAENLKVEMISRENYIKKFPSQEDVVFPIVKFHQESVK